MTLHIVAYLLCIPMLVSLGIYNTKYKILTTGEIRFWGTVLLIATDFVLLGAFN